MIHSNKLSENLLYLEMEQGKKAQFLLFYMIVKLETFFLISDHKVKEDLF